MVVLNLVAGFQALGTLLSVGIMKLPATAARFWSRDLGRLALAAFLIATVSSLASRQRSNTGAENCLRI